MVLALEGGYAINRTAECAAACTRVLLGEEPPPLPPNRVTPNKACADVFHATLIAQAAFWQSLKPLVDRGAWQDRWGLEYYLL